VLLNKTSEADSPDFQHDNDALTKEFLMADVPPPSAKHRDYHGEQQMGFFWGERGYVFVDGPSGAAGHRTNAGGEDGLAFRPSPEDLLILDNKSYARASNASKATAIDPAVNLGQNLDTMITRVRNMKDLPNQSRILVLLQQARQALRTGRGWPHTVRLVVMNAGGQSTGVTQGLAGRGVQFVDYYQTPVPFSFASRARAAFANQNVAAAMGVALGQVLQWVGDKSIEREVRHRLETHWKAGIQRMLSNGNGVLVVIMMQEWAQPDFNGQRAHALLDVTIVEGPTQERALARWKTEKANVLRPGWASGWKPYERYGWIPPVAVVK
jgi:hypothetical protein